MTGSIPGYILVYIRSQLPAKHSGKMLRKYSLLNNIRYQYIVSGLYLSQLEPLNKFGESVCLGSFIFELLVTTIDHHDMHFMLGIYCWFCIC